MIQTVKELRRTPAFMRTMDSAVYLFPSLERTSKSAFANLGHNHERAERDPRNHHGSVER